MPESTPLREHSYLYVETEEDLEDALAALPREGVIGLDTETFWENSSNRSRVSLVQLADSTGEAFVVDVLAVGVEGLRPILERTEPALVAHNARFDQMVLAGVGVQAAGLIDTLQMARMSLSLGSYSLASVAEHLFGVALDKSFQKSNWRRRPLSKAQLSYAAYDAVVALQVYEELKGRLEAEGRFEQVLRASLIEAPDPNRKPRKTRPKVEISPPLTAEEKRVVRSLKGWRLERARAQNVPAYMICPDRTLEHMARVRPESIEALGGVYGLGESKITRFGEELLAALREACAANKK